jgi:hypothetical protein
MTRLASCVALAAALGAAMPMARADVFTYHGTLQEAGRPAQGPFDLELTLYSAASGGHAVAGPVTLYNVDVKDGNFSTQLDFGTSGTTTQESWVGVRVKAAGASDFTALDLRSPVAPDGGCPGSWALDGNAAIPGGSYLGTTDANDVVVKANASTVAIFHQNGSTGISFPYSTSGAYSTAIGYNAGTNFDGSLVTGGRNDATFGTTVRDSATNQVVFVAQHGVGINTSHSANSTLPLREELTIAPSSGLPAANADLSLITPVASGYGGFDIQAVPNGYFDILGMYATGSTVEYDTAIHVNYVHGSHNAYVSLNSATGTGAFRVGDPGKAGGGAYLSEGGVWTNASSRTFKDGFAHVDVGGVLERLVSLPVQTWFYKASHGEGKHMGPVAEDFAAAFGLGNDDQHITTVDEGGIAFAAIQGLNAKVEHDNEALRRENAELRSALDAVVARLDRLDPHGE